MGFMDDCSQIPNIMCCEFSPDQENLLFSTTPTMFLVEGPHPMNPKTLASPTKLSTPPSSPPGTAWDFLLSEEDSQHMMLGIWEQSSMKPHDTSPSSMLFLKMQLPMASP